MKINWRRVRHKPLWYLVSRGLQFSRTRLQIPSQSDKWCIGDQDSHYAVDPACGDGPSYRQQPTQIDESHHEAHRPMRPQELRRELVSVAAMRLMESLSPGEPAKQRHGGIHDEDPQKYDPGPEQCWHFQAGHH